MAKKEFKAESKKLLDLMINSIYTNKEIFLRELISNANDALDKLYYESLTNKSVKVKKKDLQIHIEIDKEKRLLIISDNGIGMNKDELNDNLGTIAKSGSEAFKEAINSNKVSIIGQFGVGFYSSFMVSDKVEVESKKYDSDGYKWVSEGISGYDIKPFDKKDIGTKIILHIKENTNDEEYDKYLEEFTIKGLIKKYSDYVRYSIIYGDDKEPINSMIPLWKKTKKSIKEEEYIDFYQDKFHDYAKPTSIIHMNTEGLVSYDAILFVPAQVPYDYYMKDYQKGLELYSNGVLVMDKCSDLLPDYLNFVKGVVDSIDLPLNISRETLQKNKNLQVIAKSIEKRVLKELSDLLENDRKKYEDFFKVFGMPLKYGIYDNFGAKKEELKDLILFYSSNDKNYVTLKEYESRMDKDSKEIYYACGESVDKLDLIPQVESLKEKGKEVLYLTEYVDEFTIKAIGEYDGKKFINVSSNLFDITTEEEKESLKKKNEIDKDMLNFIKENLGEEVKEVRYTSNLKRHPVCLISDGEISTEMQKVINAMPTDEHVEAKLILEINEDHAIVDKLRDLYDSDKDELIKYSKILYDNARLIEGLPIDNPLELSELVANIISK